MNRRYKGKKTEFGINSEFFKTLIKPRIRYSFDGKALKIQKPQNQAEIAMLSKFIFGIELTCRFEYCHDKFADEVRKIENPKYNWLKASSDDIRFLRYFKLYKLDPSKKDYIPKSAAPSNASIRDNKMVLVYLRYFCNVPHDNYNDNKFNNEVFKSSYELDSHFWIHCIGELTCGGISSCSKIFKKRKVKENV